MKIEKIFRYNQKDLVDFGMSAFIYKRIGLSLVLTIIFVAALVTLYFTNDGLGQVEIVLALIYAFVLIVTPVVARSQMKRAYGSSQIFKEEQQFTLTDSEFLGKSTSGESRVEWDKFYKFIIYKNNIGLYISTRQAFILPKKIFTQAEMDELIGFLTTDQRTKKKVKLSKYI